MLMMFLGRDNPLHALMLLGPVPVILYMTFRHAMGRAEDEIGHLGKVNKVYLAAIEALAHAIDAKDQVTSDHIRRVQDNSLSLARARRDHGRPASCRRFALPRCCTTSASWRCPSTS